MEVQDHFSIGLSDKSLRALINIANVHGNSDVGPEILKACVRYVLARGQGDNLEESLNGVMESARFLAIGRHHRGEVHPPRVATVYAGGAEQYAHVELPLSVSTAMFAFGYIRGVHRNDVIRVAIDEYVEYV